MRDAARAIWQTQRTLVAFLLGGLFGGSVILALCGGFPHKEITLLLRRVPVAFKARAAAPTGFEELFGRYGNCGSWQEDYIALHKSILASDGPQRILRVVGVQTGLTVEERMTACWPTQRTRVCSSSHRMWDASVQVARLNPPLSSCLCRSDRGCNQRLLLCIVDTSSISDINVWGASGL